MSRPLLTCGLLTIVAVMIWSASFERANCDTATESSEDDGVERLLLLTPGEPLRIDLRIMLDGRPLSEVWRERIEELAKTTARSAKGTFTAEEALQLCDLASGDFGQEISRARLREELHRLSDKQDVIETTPLLTYLQQTLPPFNIAIGLTPGTTAAPALFGLLDADQDRQLSRAELEGASRRLSIRDFDSNELISERELIVDPTQHLAGAAIEDLIDERSSPEPDKVLWIRSYRTVGSIGAAMLRRYDRDDDKKIGLDGTSPELSLKPKTASRLDANSDHQLDANELETFATESQAATLALSFGSAGPVRSSASEPLPLEGLRMRKKIDGGYKLYLGDLQLDVNRHNRDPRQNGGSDLRFSRFDADQNGYLDRMESKASPLIAASFDGMDTDRDEKVMPGEFQIYVDGQNAAAANRVRVQVVDRGQDLFAVLDGNGDGLLTPRELKDASMLIDSQDDNGDGALGGFEIPVRWSLDISRGLQRSAQNIPPARRVRSAQLARTDAGPAWFRNMDRNHDSDLTRREFLGTAVDFAEADANHDGLVDIQEAGQFRPQQSGN